MANVSGIWLRTIGETIEVLAEVRCKCSGYPGSPQWRLVISENRDGNISHIIEESGIINAPNDTLSEYDI